MSSSTTQSKQIETVDAFQKELQKKIRNKQKKLENIAQLEQKIKAKEIKPNEEQLQKVASKASIQSEIDEVTQYLTLYKVNQTETIESQKKIAKQHAKEVEKARKGVITTVANMISMKLMQECGQSIPENIDEGVKHFSECLNKLLCRNQGAIHWRQERDCFIQCWTKLAQGSQDTVPHTETSFEELAQGIAESISSGGIAEVITCNCAPVSGACPAKCCNKPKRERKPKHKDVEEAPVEEVKPEEPAVEEQPVVEAEAVVEAVVAEEPEPVQEEVVAAEETPAQEVDAAGVEETPAEEEKKESSERVHTGEVRRGQRRERGNGEDRRGRGRGEYRGRGGDRGRGGRGGRGGVNRFGEDAEGFTVVKAGGEENQRGRGRGGRGWRGRGDGERGAFRGDGERPRGDRRGRGERPPRRGDQGQERPAAEQTQAPVPTPAE